MSKKVLWKPGNMIYPLPAVMVSCGSKKSDYNIITVAWTGTVCSDPVMTYVSLRPNRHSYQLIKDSGEFVINLTTEDLAFATDWCGCRSGRDYNKFKKMKLTAVKGEHVLAPIIKESPVNIECRVTEVKDLGIHHMFLAEVLGVQADEKYLDDKGAFHLEDASPITYVHGKYYTLGEYIGHFGYSVKKKK